MSPSLACIRTTLTLPRPTGPTMIEVLIRKTISDALKGKTHVSR